MRLAFVTPLPPAPTGVADYACDVLALLAAEPKTHGHNYSRFVGGSGGAQPPRSNEESWLPAASSPCPPSPAERCVLGNDTNESQRTDAASAPLAAQAERPFEIDVFHSQSDLERSRVPGACGLFSASELLARHASHPYDLVVYQLGNSLAHAFVYELLPRLPGLVVLHDLVLHHSRARHFLESPAALAYASDPSRADLRAAALLAFQGYRDELQYTYPQQAARLYDAQLETVGTLLPYAYPLCRLPLEAARGVVVHNETLAAAVRDEVAGALVVRVPMPVTAAPVAETDVQALRAQLGFAPEDFVVAAFGLLTAEKRVETLARAVTRASAALPRLRLLLVGPVPDGDAGRSALLARLHALGVGARALVTGRVPFVELPLHMAAADVAVHLRYPTARETSAVLLRLLAQGRPVVMSDLEHQADVPADAVVRVDVADEEGEVTRAILRLAQRPSLRAALGRRAAEFAAREHAPERARAGYVAALEAARRRPAPTPRPDWPAHWREAAATR